MNTGTLRGNENEGGWSATAAELLQVYKLLIKFLNMKILLLFCIACTQMGATTVTVPVSTAVSIYRVPVATVP